jgi:hypothetical protein
MRVVRRAGLGAAAAAEEERRKRERVGAGKAREMLPKARRERARRGIRGEVGIVAVVWWRGW